MLLFLGLEIRNILRNCFTFPFSSYLIVNFYLSIQIKVAGSYLNFIFFREVSINFPLSMWTVIPHFSLSPKYVLWWYYTIYL